MFLLDINVMFAVLNKTHGAHSSVMRWLETIDHHASCGLTQIGTFRLLLTPAPMHGKPLEPCAAHESMARFMGLRKHRFVACPALSSSIVGRTATMPLSTITWCRLPAVQDADWRRWIGLWPSAGRNTRF